MACDQVTVARKLADLAARPRIHIPARQGERGMQRVDRWMTENTKTVHSMHLYFIYIQSSALYCLVILVKCFLHAGALSVMHRASQVWACTTPVYSVWVF